MDKFPQDPDANLDYLFNWGENYLTDGDTITASAWSVTPTPDEGGLELGADSFDDTTATVWLSGGTTGSSYTVTNHITTLGGREDDRSIIIQIKER